MADHPRGIPALQLPGPKFLQHAFAQKVGIALAGLGKLDDSPSEALVGEIDLVGKAESDPRHLEGDADDPPGLRVGTDVVEKWCDRHGAVLAPAGVRPSCRI